MPCLPVASTSSLPGSLPHSDIVNKSHIGFQMLSSSFAILCLPFYKGLRDMRMCPGPPRPLDILILCKSRKGKPVLRTPGKQPHCPSTSFFRLPLQSLGRARSTKSTQPAGPSLGEQFGSCFSTKGDKQASCWTETLWTNAHTLS